MMEPLAENRYTLTKELFSEGMRRVIAENYGKTAKRAVLALLGAWIVLAVVTIVLRQSPVYIAVEAVVLALAALWVSVYIPRAKTRAAWKKLSALYGDNLERTTRFYEDRLVVDAAGREIALAYEEIARVLSSERLLILVSADKTGILVKRDSFIRGSEQTTLAIIRPESQNI